MKACCTILTVIFLRCAVAGNACASDGLDYLRESKPIEASSYAVRDKNSPVAEMYKKQLAILQSIPASKTVEEPDKFVSTLVSYLDYTPTPLIASSAPMPPPSLEHVKTTFPVFALLLESGGLDDSLRKFIRSRDSEVRLKLAALAVLRFRNESAFLSVRSDFEKEPWAEKPEVVQYLKFLDKKDAFFWGIPRVAFTSGDSP